MPFALVGTPEDGIRTGLRWPAQSTHGASIGIENPSAFNDIENCQIFRMRSLMLRIHLLIASILSIPQVWRIQGWTLPLALPTVGHQNLQDCYKAFCDNGGVHLLVQIKSLAGSQHREPSPRRKLVNGLPRSRRAVKYSISMQCRMIVVWGLNIA